ncbi:hypothetical protein KCP76_12220 [Salmonella enterica subsp. enterica serovar Weltevreden]|nr:hypothetical protein KCP76_12220 [Salmonella enterica subsp. enterica serovar Weltevreden]
MLQIISPINVLRCWLFCRGATLARLPDTHFLLFEEGIAHSAAFLRRTLRFGRCGYFRVLADGFFCFFSRLFFRCFRFRFFSPRKALSGSANFFTYRRRLPAFLLSIFFSLFHAPFCRRCRGALAGDQRHFLFVHIHRFDAYLDPVACAICLPTGPLPIRRRLPDRSDSNRYPVKRVPAHDKQFIKTDKEAETGDAGTTPLKTLPT